MQPATAPDDDEALVEQARRDPRAFTPLYDRYARAIYGYCLRRLGQHAAAEDATSQTFFRALDGVRHYRGGSFRGWLFAIAHNTVADVYRRGHSHQPLSDADEIADSAPTPEEAAIAGDDRQALSRLLAGLTTDQREVLELRLAGLDGVAIAAALGKSHGAVRALLFRATTQLRAQLINDDVTTEARDATPLRK